MKTIFLSILITLVSSEVTFRLSTKELTQLKVQSSITSTLGLFKATLRETKCSLDIQFFDQTTYVFKGSYTSPNVSQNCFFLQITEGSIITSQNQTFMYVGDSFNESTILTIDDLGVIRLIGSYIKSTGASQESIQFSVDTFYTPQKYIYAGSQLNVRFQNSYGPLINDNGWSYSAEAGQFQLRSVQDPNKSVSYVYSMFKFNNSQIQGFNSKTFPGAIFSDITFEPRCFEPRIYLNFKAPFIIMADQHFPRLTVLEQGGYKIFELIYSKKSEVTYQQENYDLDYRRHFSLCPDGTFEHKGQCLTECPSPYFHEMRGSAGTCRLVCEEYTPIDIEKRICTCMDTYQATKYNSQAIKPCPNDTVKYPYGCYCNITGKFFEKKMTFSCVEQCPETTFAHQGLCVDCPINCLKCGTDSLSRMFLECKICDSGYTLNDGQCFNECNSNLGFSLTANGTCLKCKDENCVNCSENSEICLKCGILFTLSNGSCLQSCPQNMTLVSTDFFGSECLASEKNVCNAFLSLSYKSKAYLKCDDCVDAFLIPHLDSCVASCPQGYKRYENITGSYYCSCKIGRTVGDQCLNITGCPMKMYYDLFSDSCLSCPFGCISCRGSICTSCYPGYFLYVSPQVIMCRRKSPLFGCNGQYSLWNEICLVSDFQNLKMALCRENVPNCRVCPFKAEFRTSICVVCEKGFYLHENNCFKQCPAGMMPYADSVCILIEIQNCSIPYFRSKRQASFVDISIIEKSKAYEHYVFQGTEYANDPVGYIAYFQKITSSKRLTDGLYRENSFFEPEWICLKCKDGYGLSKNRKECILCPQPCATCYMASNLSCLTKITCQGYIEFETKQCIKSCNSTNSFPKFINKTLYCMHRSNTNLFDFNRFDSASYKQANGSYLTYIFFKQPLFALSTARIILGGSNNFLGCSQQEKNCIPDKQNVSRRVKLVPTERVVPVIDGQYVEILTELDEYIAILNLTDSISKLESEGGKAPPNLIYGADFKKSHPQFLKQDYSYLGTIVGLFILAFQWVYVGTETLYKMDNLIITGQTVFLFSFTRPFMGEVLGQFYNGWGVILHLTLLPNFFTIPENYRQTDAPIPYKLATTDANFLRNAGHSICWLLIFSVVWSIVSGIVYKMHNYIAAWEELWQKDIAICAIVGTIEFFSLNVLYWAVAHLKYGSNCKDCDSSFHGWSVAVAIIFIILIGGWAIFRVCKMGQDPAGALYMYKRIYIALLMALFKDNLGWFIPFLSVEAMFTVCRFYWEEPQQRSEKVWIIIEYVMITTINCLMYFNPNFQLIAGFITTTLAASCLIWGFDLGKQYNNSQGLIPLKKYDPHAIEHFLAETNQQMAQRQAKNYVSRFRFNRAYAKQLKQEQNLSEIKQVQQKQIWLYPEGAPSGQNVFHPIQMTVPKHSFKPNHLNAIRDAYENKALHIPSETQKKVMTETFRNKQEKEGFFKQPVFFLSSSQSETINSV